MLLKIIDTAPVGHGQSAMFIDLGNVALLSHNTFKKWSAILGFSYLRGAGGQWIHATGFKYA